MTATASKPKVRIDYVVWESYYDPEVNADIKHVVGTATDADTAVKMAREVKSRGVIEMVVTDDSGKRRWEFRPMPVSKIRAGSNDPWYGVAQHEKSILEG